MNNIYDRLDELYAAGDQAAAEGFLLDVIGKTSDQSPERAGLLNELAGFYRGVSRYAESEESFGQSLKIFESAGMSTTPEYATVLMNLAGLYRMRGDADKAVELFFDAMRKLEDLNFCDSYTYVSVVNNLALAYQSKGELKQALEYATKALNLMRAQDGKEHEVATSLNNVSSIYLGLGDLETADSMISEALDIYAAMENPDVHYAAALTTKAVLMFRSGNYRNSLDGFRHALELTKHFFGENIEFAICKRNISEVCEMLGDIPTALSELSEAVRILERILGTDHNSVSSARKKLNELVLTATYGDMRG